MKIDGRTALITGGASGLGAAAVRRIVASGGKAVLLDVQEEKARVLADELGTAALFCRTRRPSPCPPTLRTRTGKGG